MLFWHLGLCTKPTGKEVLKCLPGFDGTDLDLYQFLRGRHVLGKSLLNNRIHL